MDLKTLFAVVSVSIGMGAFIPYFRDIWIGKTRPHVFTWLILSLTQGSATVILWLGGGGLGAVYFTIGMAANVLVMVKAFWNGNSDVAFSDQLALFFALGSYNFLTLFYILAITSANFALTVFLLVRRRSLR